MKRFRAILTGRVGRVVLVIAALTVLADLAVERLGVRYCQPIGHEPTMAAWAYQHGARDLDAVFVGSSRIHFGVVPGTVEEAFRETTGREIRAWCLGVEAGTVMAYYPVVRDLLDGPRAPKVLVVGLSPRAVNSNSARNRLALTYFGSPGDWWRECRIRGPWATDWRAIASGVFGRPTALAQWAMVSGGYRAKQIRSIQDRRGGVHPPLGPDERVEDLPGAPSEDKWERLAAARLQFARDDLLRDFDIQGRADHAFRRMAEAARARGIRMVAVNVPTHPTFDMGYKPGEYETYIESMVRTCGELGVAWRDLNVAPFRSPDRDLWRDMDHMNRRGALRLSRLLGSDVLPEYLPPPE